MSSGPREAPVAETTVVDPEAARLDGRPSRPSETSWAEGPPSRLWELLGYLTSFKHNVERLKLYKASVSVIKFLCVLNVSYSLVGLTFLGLACFPTQHLNFTQLQRTHFFRLGLFISTCFPLATFADLIALRGLRQWRRNLLLPWLILYAILIALAFSVAVTEALHRGLRWQLLLLALCSLCVLSGWRQVRLQYTLMGVHTERPMERTVDELADALREANVRMAPPKFDDPLPPKYEDLEQPPRYDESMLAGRSERAEGSTEAAVESERPTARGRTTPDASDTSPSQP